MAKIEQTNPTGQTWCQRHGKVRCMGVCGLITLVFLIIMAIGTSHLEEMTF